MRVVPRGNLTARVLRRFRPREDGTGTLTTALAEAAAETGASLFVPTDARALEASILAARATGGAVSRTPKMNGAGDVDLIDLAPANPELAAPTAGIGSNHTPADHRRPYRARARDGTKDARWCSVTGAARSTRADTWRRAASKWRRGQGRDRRNRSRRSGPRHELRHLRGGPLSGIDGLRRYASPDTVLVPPWRAPPPRQPSTRRALPGRCGPDGSLVASRLLAARLRSIDSRLGSPPSCSTRESPCLSAATTSRWSGRSSTPAGPTGDARRWSPSSRRRSRPAASDSESRSPPRRWPISTATPGSSSTKAAPATTR